MLTAPLVLASASPRRKALLAELGVGFDVAAADIDETPPAGVAPWRHVVDLATAKSAVVSARHPHADVIGADTEVVVDEVNRAAAIMLGKPTDRAHAEQMLRQLAGRTVHVVTGLAVRRADGRLSTGPMVSKLAVRSISDDEIAAYLATGDADDKAGALAVQGAAASFVTSIEGCYTNVVGLPLCRVAALVAPEVQWSCHGAAPSCDAVADAVSE